MKGLEKARTVRMNHVGWAIMRHFKFFLSLQETFRYWYVCPVFSKCFVSVIFIKWIPFINILIIFSINNISFTVLTTVYSHFCHNCLNCSDIFCLTSCRSSGSISSASWCRASSCEELLHSGKQSCNLLQPVAPGCSQRTWWHEKTRSDLTVQQPEGLKHFTLIAENSYDQIVSKIGSSPGMTNKTS